MYIWPLLQQKAYASYHLGGVTYVDVLCLFFVVGVGTPQRGCVGFGTAFWPFPLARWIDSGVNGVIRLGAADTKPLSRAASKRRNYVSFIGGVVRSISAHLLASVCFCWCFLGKHVPFITHMSNQITFETSMRSLSSAGGNRIFSSYSGSGAASLRKWKLPHAAKCAMCACVPCMYGDAHAGELSNVT